MSALRAVGVATAGVARRLLTSGIGLAPLVVALAYWQATGPQVSITFPRPSTWIIAFQDMYADHSLGPALQTTLVTFFASLALAIVIGTFGGVVVGAFRRVDAALGPLIDFFRSLPPPAIVPVLGLIIGLSLTTNIAIVTVAIVWPILLNTASGMRSIPSVRLEMARSLGIGPAGQLWKVVLPSLAPHIMVGVRIAASICLIVTLLADMLGTGDGLGRQLLLRQENFQAAGVWALLVLVGLLGYLVNASVVVAEQYFIDPWFRGSGA